MHCKCLIEYFSTGEVKKFLTQYVTDVYEYLKVTVRIFFLQSSESRPFTKARTDSMSSETNGAYRGNENESRYRSAVAHANGGAGTEAEGEYHGTAETNGKYHAVDTNGPYDEQYHETATNLTRRPSTPPKAATPKNSK